VDSRHEVATDVATSYLERSAAVPVQRWIMPMSESGFDDGWNQELEEEVKADGIGSLVVYSRDWTVETIISQITKGNIDLNPKFQRRNAWNDIKRSKLIESLIMGIPVPEIVLAEDKDKKRSFIVIDGKQRLMAIAGFADPDKFDSWQVPKLRGLNTREDLNGLSFAAMADSDGGNNDRRELMNADMRCTVISNYQSSQVLYDIFYRLNTGSVPLSSQELRQVLNRGDFADFLVQFTNQTLPLHKVLNLSGPDARLRDAEILLRYISFSLFGREYTGNLTPFLDTKMEEVNKNWPVIKGNVESLSAEFNDGTEALIEALTEKKVGRKFTVKGWETRFNRALFEVEVYYAARVGRAAFVQGADNFTAAFETMCTGRPDFIDSIEASTKNIDKYHTRFEIFQSLINSVFCTSIASVPVPKRS